MSRRLGTATGSVMFFVNLASKAARVCFILFLCLPHTAFGQAHIQDEIDGKGPDEWVEIILEEYYAFEQIDQNSDFAAPPIACQ